MDVAGPSARASESPPSLAGESDTESVEGVPEPDVEGEVLEPSAAVEPMAFESRPGKFHAAFASLDDIDLKVIFSNRAAVMRSVPSFLQGAFRTTMRVALTELVKGIDEQSNVRMTRGWKLFLLLPRLLLHKPFRGGLVPKKILEARFHLFQMGHWQELLDASIHNAAKIHHRSVRRRRREAGDEIEKRASRALSLVQMGELSAARQALDGAPVAPGTLATLRALTDPEKRPPTARQELSDEIQHSEPAEPFELNVLEFLLCLRSARRGAAAGPSELLSRVASTLATGCVPGEVLQGLRLARSQL